MEGGHLFCFATLHYTGHIKCKPVFKILTYKERISYPPSSIYRNEFRFSRLIILFYLGNFIFLPTITCPMVIQIYPMQNITYFQKAPRYSAKVDEKIQFSQSIAYLFSPFYTPSKPYICNNQQYKKNKATIDGDKSRTIYLAVN